MLTKKLFETSTNQTSKSGIFLRFSQIRPKNDLENRGTVAKKLFFFLIPIKLMFLSLHKL